MCIFNVFNLNLTSFTYLLCVVALTGSGQVKVSVFSLWFLVLVVVFRWKVFKIQIVAFLFDLVQIKLNKKSTATLVK